MNYNEAIERLAQYQYLVGKEITERTNGLKYKIEFVTILDKDSKETERTHLLNPLDSSYAKLLEGKDCMVAIITEYNPILSGRVFISEDALGNYSV